MSATNEPGPFASASSEPDGSLAVEPVLLEAE
jgi:hypothetical protein